MRAHFLQPTPRFGRVNHRLPIGHQQRSPYYWWWAYLRRNADYLACCGLGGMGELAGRYADFGDVREDDFHAWWTKEQRGVKLFAEVPLELHLSELTSVDEWQPQWTQDQVMVLAIPLRVSKRRLKGQFAKMLERRHPGKQGRPAIAQQASTARYTLARNYTIPNLQTMLAVYDLWNDNQQRSGKDKLKLWEIGIELRLNKDAAKDAQSQFSEERLEGRNVLAATVSRYVKQAKAIIANTAKGQFPLS